jgi:indole-3-glycerol phosphate synthase
VSRDFLAEIIAQKRRLIDEQRGRIDTEALRACALERRRAAETHRLQRSLEAASPTIKIIAEFKRRSPSAGAMREDVSAAELACRYERAGACAMSVLTEAEYFGGSGADLKEARAATRLPLLCKDFIMEPLQLYQAALAGADAALLIAAALNGDSLGELRAIAEDELGLDALVEVHTSAELQCALYAGTKIVGVNNRDLRTFEVSFATSERLIQEAPDSVLMVSESGLVDAEAVRHLHRLGFDGFLIGETLMRAPDPEAALRELTG